MEYLSILVSAKIPNKHGQEMKDWREMYYSITEDTVSKATPSLKAGTLGISFRKPMQTHSGKHAGGGGGVGTFLSMLSLKS